MTSSGDKRDANRRVRFDEAGHGVELVFRNSALRVLSAKYGQEYFNVVEKGLFLCDIALVEECLELAAYIGDEKAKIELDDLDSFPMEVLVNKLLDAWSLSLNGRLYQEQVKHIQEHVAKQGGKETLSDPLKPSPEDTSDSSSEQPTGQA